MTEENEPETAIDASDLPRISTAEVESDACSPPDLVVRKGGTFEALGYRAYLLFWSGAFVSNVGNWMQATALGIVVWGFRRSEADLGIVNFAAQIPTLFLTLAGGVLADRIDKRKLIIWAQVGLMAQALIIGSLYVTGHLSAATPVAALIWVSGLSLAAGVLTAFSFPAWQAIIPDLVPRPTLLNAIALNSAQFQSARMLGPLAASAILLMGLGMADIFWINAVSFLFVIGALWTVPSRTHPPQTVEGVPESSWGSLKAGILYAASHRMIGIVILSTAIMTVFGMPYLFLLPSVADRGLGFRGAELRKVYTYLMAASGLGALVGALIVASLPRSIRRERLMRWSILATALFLLAFAFTPWLWLSLTLSALAGASVLTTNSLANTSVQSSVPNHLRGRVMSLFIMSFLGLMPLSAITFGPLAEAIGPSGAIAGGALVLLAWALVLIARPSLLTHRKPQCS